MARTNEYIMKIDRSMGNKISSLRIARGFSRQQLSEFIGVTHQQLQKYEKGTNRISVGRLVLIAKALEQDVSYFYDNLDIAKSNTNYRQRMCMELSRNFMKIENPDLQNAINGLVKSLSKN